MNAAIAFSPGNPNVTAPRWVRSWGASPQAPDNSVTAVEPFADATLRQVVRLSGGGSTIRIRLTNEYGSAPITIGGACIGLADVDGNLLSDGISVTFGGRPDITVPPGAPALSDAVDLPAPDLSRLTISLYLPGRIDTITCHGTLNSLGWIIPGNRTALGSLPANAELLPTQALISAVEVLPDTPTAAVSVIGDSRVDGIGSTPGTDGRWTDVLAERLSEYGGTTRCVVNQGIGGNCLLADGFGTAALARFDRDVLATPGLSHVVIAVGNDLVFSYAPRDGEGAEMLEMFPCRTVTPDDVIAAHCQLVARSRAHGVKISAATIAPYGGSEMYSSEGNNARETINDWIRTSDAFDSVLDFDAVWRDPADLTRIRDDLHMGDHLHGNDAGYRALGESIDLDLFD